MSIFRRDDELPAEPAKPEKPARAPSRTAKHKSSPNDPTQIASGSKVVGEISGEADLFIDGVVDGEINLDSRVVVGTGGRVEGTVLAREVEVGGKVLGNVKGLARVEVLATGSLEGDVMSPRVVIAEGAFFKGRVEMTDNVKRHAVPGPSQPAAKPADETPPDAGRPAREEPRPDAGRPAENRDDAADSGRDAEKKTNR